VYAAPPVNPERLTQATVALTPAGIADLDEAAGAAALQHVLVAARTAAGAYRPAAQVAGAVALASADAPAPPDGQVGYFSGGRTAIAKTTSFAGRTLFVKVSGDEVTTDLPAQLGSLMADGTGSSGSSSSSGSGSSGSSTGSFSGTFTSSVAHAVHAAGLAGPRARTAADDTSDKDRTPALYKRDEPQVSRDGVRATRHGRRVTFRFTGASAFAFKDIRGRRVKVTCLTPPKPTGSPFPHVDLQALLHSVNHVVVRVPRTGGAVTATLKHARDLCTIVDDDNEVALAGVTTTGRRFAQDSDAVMTFLDGIGTLKAGRSGGAAYRPADEVVAQDRKGVTALSSPDESVPFGQVGYWTNNKDKAAFAASSATGRHVLYEDKGNGIIRTNLVGVVAPVLDAYIFGAI
jgi:hypothetical protein